MFRNILQRSNHNIRRFSTSPLKQKSLITDFHHIKLFTGSANATKELFMNKFNFKLHSFSGPETGNKETLNYLLINGNMKIIVTTPLGNETYTQRIMNNFLSTWHNNCCLL